MQNDKTSVSYYRERFGDFLKKSYGEKKRYYKVQQRR